MIKLIAIDLDGTLLDSKREVSSENRDALHYAEAAGCKIVICTGRPYLSMSELVEEIGFTSSDDYIITFNGGQTQKAATGEVVQADTLSVDDMQLWQTELDRLDLPMNVIDGEYIYEPVSYPDSYPSLYIEPGFSKAPVQQKDFDSFHPGHRFNKIVIGTDADHLKRQQRLIVPHLLSNYSLTMSYPWLMEVSSLGVNKGAAVKSLAGHLGIDQAEVMTIGDQLNDLTMVQYAGLGVAMANAVPEVKRAAQFISKSNNQNGVAYAIYKFVG